MVDDRALTREQIRDWIHKHLATAPKRSELWGEQILATYLGEPPPSTGIAA